MGLQFLSKEEVFTPAVHIKTALPFPEYPAGPVSEDGQDDDKTPLLPQASKTEQIHVEHCSELTEYRAALEFFPKNEKFQLIHATSGVPIVFTLDEEKHAAGWEGWACTDITPAGKTVSTFDVLQLDNTAFIAISCTKAAASDLQDVRHCTLELPAEVFSPETLLLKSAAEDSGLEWQSIPQNAEKSVGTLDVSSVSCQTNIETGTATARIVIGTASTADRTGSHYLVDPTAGVANPWVELTFPAAASKLVQTEPLCIPRDGDLGGNEHGMISLFNDSPKEDGRRRAVGHIFGPHGGYARFFELKAGKLGQLNSVFSHRNPWGFTDVFVASEKGIGVVKFEKHDYIDQVILPETSFINVVCSEEVDEEAPEERTKLSIFAVSAAKHLYFIEGSRDFATRNLTFRQSGLPIRTGVTHLSAKYNTSYYSSELLYAGEEENALHHLRRSPTGRAWMDDTIKRRSTKQVKYDAYVTTITLTDSAGQPVGEGYPVKIASEPLQVVINGKSVSLSHNLTEVETDGSGCVMIAIPSADKLSCPSMDVKIDCIFDNVNAAPAKFKIDPSARSERLMSKFKDVKDMRNVTTVSGEQPFDGFDKEKLDAGCSVLNKYDSMKESVATGKPPAGFDEDQDEENKPTSKIEKFLGDVIDCVKYVVKKAAKIVFKVVGGVLKLAFKVLGKYFSFVLDTIDTLLTGLGTFLENTFGWDGLTKFLKLLKLVFSKESIAKTQRVLSHDIDGALGLGERMLVLHKEKVKDYLNYGEQFLKQFMNDPRAPAPEKKPSSGKSAWGWLFNNPVVRLLKKLNPLEWIMEAFAEEMSDWTIPDITPMLDEMAQVTKDFGSAQTDNVIRLIMTFVNEVAKGGVNSWTDKLFNLLKSIGWTLFDSLKNSVEVLYDAFIVLARGLRTLITGVWKIPGLTDLWEDITGQEFTILNALTYPLALLSNLVAMFKGTMLAHEESDLVDFAAIPDSDLIGGSGGGAVSSPEVQLYALNAQSNAFTSPHTMHLAASTWGGEAKVSMSQVRSLDAAPVSGTEQPQPVPEWKKKVNASLGLVQNLLRVYASFKTFLGARKARQRRREVAIHGQGQGPYGPVGNNNNPDHPLRAFNRAELMSQLVPLSLHGFMLILSNFFILGDTTQTIIGLGCGAGEIVLSAFTLLRADAQANLRGAAAEAARNGQEWQELIGGYMAQAGTIVTSFDANWKASPAGWVMVGAAGCSVVAMSLAKCKRYEWAMGFAAVDVLASLPATIIVFVDEIKAK